MSPLVNPPNRGYSDEQRVVNYDSGVVFSAAPNNTGVPIFSNWLDVSRFAYLGGLLWCTQNSYQVNINWAMDSLGTIGIAARSFVVSGSIPHGACIRIPNLAPFFQIGISGTGAGNFSGSIELFGTNRVHPLEFIPQDPVLIDIQGGAIGASATVVTYPNDYYAGPCNVWTFINGNAGTLTFQYLTTGNAWDDLDGLSIVANTNMRLVTVMPPGAWRVEVANGAAVATTYFIAVTPSTTGAI